MSSEQILIPDIGDFDSVDVIEVLVNIGDSIEYDMPDLSALSCKALRTASSSFNRYSLKVYIILL